MKILIVSDTHGSHKALTDVVRKEEPLDMMIHLGDVEGGEDYIEGLTDCEKHIVRGNNDFFSRLEKEEEFSIGRYHAFITHGHNYYVSLDPETIREEALSRGADIVMFGHTHRPYLEQDDDIVVLNPGSLVYPRQEGRRGSYMIMEIGEDGDAKFVQKFV
ncbi:YfcE family phosphodiesterase [Hespellia stercorisuis]|uniref:Phosphoesterase n=1 Tax=Hespellia stercorisuis DSM 15480 TaxID=1121950 RepID=A0A1M6NVH1_9FIRM|nr:metallophosphoesterase [Hespellia stercorisuis]SHJ99759.1 hypothetical protein SAMN02745243_01929 [Hespellia stercorisuis DSM 15480]